MSEQNYSNHTRFYAPHHFILYPAITAFTVFCAVRGFNDPANSAIWFALSGVGVLIGWLSFMLRQHYALTLQNRLVVVELRLRYFELTGQRFAGLEAQLTRAQLFALRFAGDNELPGLAQKAAAEKMSADAIKKAISNWKADEHRV